MIVVSYYDFSTRRNMFKVMKNGKIVKDGFYSAQDARVYIANVQKNNVFDIKTKKRIPSVIYKRTVVLDPIAIYNTLKDVWLDLHEGKKIDRMRLRWLLVAWNKIRFQTHLQIKDQALNKLYSIIVSKNKKFGE